MKIIPNVAPNWTIVWNTIVNARLKCAKKVTILWGNFLANVAPKLTVVNLDGMEEKMPPAKIVDVGSVYQTIYLIVALTIRSVSAPLVIHNIFLLTGSVNRTNHKYNTW
tara:strand:+ start:103 stop:429 length:327 start_codon:yes stop_codon:yes gene_type:complete